MTIAFITHPACRLHQMGNAHPDSPARLAAIEDEIIATGLEFALRRHDAPAASREQLARVHDPAYVERVFALAPEQDLVWLDQDTAMNPHTLNAALHAAGAVVRAVDLVLGNEEQCAFCSVRPPGHHAERANTLGFCFFNNVAVGAAHALDRYRLQRIAVLDFDVHHGNGTEDIFRNDPRVLFCSSFQHPCFPYPDAGLSGEHLVKTPLDPGTGSQTFRDRISRDWFDRLAAFSPELVFISAGFDAHWQDDIADLNLGEQDFSWLTGKLREIADTHAGGRIISVLEGGYALPALARSVAAHLNALLD